MNNYVDVYSREYDEPLKANGEKKNTDFLGSFRTINTIVDDAYSQTFIAANSEDDVFLITGTEVSGVNGGIRFDVCPLPELIIKENI